MSINNKHAKHLDTTMIQKLFIDQIMLKTFETVKAN